MDRLTQAKIKRSSADPQSLRKGQAMRRAKQYVPKDKADSRRRGVLGARLLGVLTLFLAFAGLLLPAGAAASKTHVFLERFGGAAQPTFTTPSSMAVDQQTHDLLVTDPGAGTLSRYHEDGTPADFSALGTNVISGLSGFGGASPQANEISVDESGTVTDGDIYVTQDVEHRVEIFNEAGEHIGALTGGDGGPFEGVLAPCGVAVGPNGHVFVSTGGEEDNPENTSKIYEFAPGGNPPINADGRSVSSGVRYPCNLRVGTGASAGALFASFSQPLFLVLANETLIEPERGAAALDPATGAVQYKFAYQKGSAAEGSNARAVTEVALDPGTGHVYVGRGESSNRSIEEYSASGESASLVDEFFPQEHGGGEGIAVDGESGRLYVSAGRQLINVYSPLVTVPDVVSGKARTTGLTTASLRGTVNPEGVELEECFFEYGPTTSYGQIKACEAPDATEVGLARGPVEVHADISSLSAESGYYFRLVAKNANATVEGIDSPFQTPSKPTIESEWAADVSFSEATVEAEVNPESAATSVRLEWGEDESYGHSTEPQSVGEGDEAKVVNVALAELDPGRTYHYRFVAENVLGTIPGPDKSFTTLSPPAAPETDCPNQALRAGASPFLPDCRAYEMVSPVDKNGSDILPMININSAPVALDQSATGGGKLTYTTYRAYGDSRSAPWGVQYLATRGPDGWSNHGISPPRGTPFAVTPFLDIEFRAFSEDLCDAWLFHETDPILAPGAIPHYPNLYRRSDCGEEGYETVTASALAPESGHEEFRPDLEGVSADGSSAVFRVEDKLTENAASHASQVYDYSAGQLHLVCVKPSGIAFGEDCTAGTSNSGQIGIRTASVHNALSADGSKLYWSGGLQSGGRIYLRLNPDQAQSKIAGGKCSQPEKACTIPVSETVTTAASRFYAASRNGSKALFGVGGNLYEFDLATEESTRIAGKVTGIAAASEDLSRVYLVSEEELAAEAPANKPNLYLYEQGAGFRFIGTDEEATGQESSLLTSNVPEYHYAQANPSGSRLVFMSNAPITGYDNIDQVSGEADAEVYLYDAAAASGAGELVCVSCNPSGQRPRGAHVKVDGQPRFWAAAEIPPAESQLYTPRAVSENGSRVFFDSEEALVPRDSDAAEDVYEWEAAGAGRCTTSSTTYSPSSAGCVSLISSGGSPDGSSFVDSSVDGTDVFFTTAASLVPEDPGLIDIYDAREGGGFATASSAAACEGEACQGPYTPPNDPTPASSNFEGPGNVSPAGAKKTKRTKSKHKKKHKKKKHGKKKHQQKSKHQKKGNTSGKGGGQ